jgi:hypothetical protein
MLEYHARRYLSRVSDNELMARHDSIARNLQSIISYNRNVLPIQSFLSSWYSFGRLQMS